MNGFMYPTSGKKVIDLGVGTSFNVSSYAGYEKFTTANFLWNANHTLHQILDMQRMTMQIMQHGRVLQK